MDSAIDFLFLYYYEKSKNSRKSNGCGEDVATAYDSMAGIGAIPCHILPDTLLALEF